MPRRYRCWNGCCYNLWGQEISRRCFHSNSIILLSSPGGPNGSTQIYVSYLLSRYRAKETHISLCSSEGNLEFSDSLCCHLCSSRPNPSGLACHPQAVIFIIRQSRYVFLVLNAGDREPYDSFTNTFASTLFGQILCKHFSFKSRQMNQHLLSSTHLTCAAWRVCIAWTRQCHLGFGEHGPS